MQAGHEEGMTIDDTASSVQPALGHRPVIPPRLGETPGRLALDVLERYRLSPVPDVSDAVGRLYTMGTWIRPLYEPMRRIVGSALTVKAPPGDNWAVYGALNRVEEGDVLVVDWRGSGEACGGGVNALISAIHRGLAGVVVDGGWRDIGELQAIDFPVAGRAISPFSPPKRELGEVNVPVCCGGVVVEPGDVVVADREGAVVVPRRHAADVAHSLPADREGPSQQQYSKEDIENGVGKIDRAYTEAFKLEGGLSDAQ